MFRFTERRREQAMPIVGAPAASTAAGTALRFGLRELDVVLEGDAEQLDLLSHLVNHASEQFEPRSTMHVRFLRTGQRGREVIEAGGAGPKRVCCDEVALGYILYRMTTRLLESNSGRTAIHCGAVSIDGRLVLFTGDRGSGKTTLLLRLLLDGVGGSGSERMASRSASCGIPIPRTATSDAGFPSNCLRRWLRCPASA